MRTRGHLSLLLTATLATLTLTVAPAAAAVPANDTIEDATVITALPFTVDQDTTDATKSDTDPRPSCDRRVKHTVWFRLTAPANGWLAADTLGSRYDTLAAVYTGGPGSLTEVACNDDTYRDGDWKPKARVYWDADAGTTYYLMVAAGYGSGGKLHLTVGASEAPFTVDAFAVDPTGSADNQAGTAVIHGTITCSNGPAEVYVEIFVRQQIGRLYISAYNGKEFSCDGVTAWRMKVSSYEGAFTAGPVEVSSDVYWQDGNGGHLADGPTTVKLRG